MIFFYTPEVRNEMTRETRNADIRIQTPSCQARLDGYSTKIGEREPWSNFVQNVYIWLITMNNKFNKVVTPSKWPKWLINGGDPNHFHDLG